MGNRGDEPIQRIGGDCCTHGEGKFGHARRTLAVALFALICAACPAALAQEPTLDDGYVILWRRVPNNFYSSTLGSDEIRQIVERSPVKTLRLNPGDTLSDQLQKQFHVNARWTPAVYSSMVSRIVDLNGLDSADAVQAGQELLVPVIPQTGSASKAQTEQGVALVLSETELRYTSERVAAFRAALSAGTEIQYIKVRPSELGRYALDLDTPQGASGPVNVTLGAAQNIAAAAVSGLLDAAVAERVRVGLTSGTGRSPVLIVVDDSIPDHTEYVRTRDFMLELSKSIREKHGFGESPFASKLGALSNQMPAAKEHELYPELVMHASVIKQSLLPMTQLDPQRRVRVIYLPLAATQMGITPIYEELLYLAELLKVAPSSPSSSAAPTAFQRNTAKTVTEEIVRRNKTVFEYGPIAFSSAGGNSFRTDRALLEALSIVLDAYSNATAQPHALSFSWTMPKLQLPTFLVPNALGWKFGAAGNHVSGPLSSADFLQRELQFAARAVGPKDVIVVLNSDGTPGPCASNLFDDSTGIQVLGLSFSGRVDAAHCGTSFSTPRVAWLFAAREAIYGQPLAMPIGTAAKVAWYEEQQGIVLGQRSNSQTTVLQRYNLEAGKLFGQ